MTRNEYFRRLVKLVDAGAISEDTFNEMFAQHDVFCDDVDPWESRLPRTYAEIQYEDMDSAEAVEGSKFDDMNYLRYMER